MSDSTVILSRHRSSDYPVLSEDLQTLLCDIVEYLERTLDVYTGLRRRYDITPEYENLHSTNTEPDDEYSEEITNNVQWALGYIVQQINTVDDNTVFGPLMRDIENVVLTSRCSTPESASPKEYYKYGTIQSIVQLLKNAIFTEDDRMSAAERTVIDRMVNDIK